MRHRDIKLGIIMMAFSLFLLIWLIPTKVEIFALGTFAEASLGPRSFPYMVAGVIGAIGMLIAINAYRKAGIYTEAPPLTMHGNIRVLSVIFASVLYLWLITLFGYMVPTFAATIGFMLLFGERRWWLMLTIAAVTAVGLYVIFGKVFHMLMPHGVIDLFYDL